MFLSAKSPVFSLVVFLMLSVTIIFTFLIIIIIIILDPRGIMGAWDGVLV